MDNNWVEEILAVSGRETEEREKRFLSLLDQVRGNIDLPVARVLLKTYSQKPDYGTQERVESILAEADKEIVIKAILEEMPRLVSEAPDWAVTLLGQEVEHRPELLQKYISLAPGHVKMAAKAILSQSEFANFYPNAISIKL